MAPSSAAAAVMEALIVAVVSVVLLHSSMGLQQPLPPPDTAHTRGSHHHHHHHHHRHHHPPPVPAPPPPPPPPPVECHSYCYYSYCSRLCSAYIYDGQAKCKSDHVANHKSCYLYCTRRVHVCHGKQTCLHSGCLVGQCDSCSSNHNATSCCELCAGAVGSDYQRCMIDYTLNSELGCINRCFDGCYKNCTRGA